MLDVPTAHCREIVDNVVDMAHFFYIHFAFPTSFRNVFEGHMATQFMESTGRPDMAGEGYGDEDLVLKSEATYFGPSFMINWLKTDYKGFVTDVVLVNCHIPTSDNSFVLQYGLKVLKPEGVDEKTTNYIGERYTHDVRRGFHAGRAHLAEQGASAESSAVRRRRPGLPAAPLVRAVLRRQGRRHPGDDGALRVRGGHHQGQRVLARRGRREPRQEGCGGRGVLVERGAAAEVEDDAAQKVGGPTAGGGV